MKSLSQSRDLAASQIVTASIRLKSLTESLQVSMKDLEDNLQPVLRAVPPSSSGNECPAEPLVPLAEDLMTTASKLEQVLFQLKSIQDRCEL